MFQLCRHIKTDGYRCQSAALRGTAFCYFHSHVRASAKANASAMGNIQIPLLEDSASIQIALSQIVGGLLNSRVDARRGGLLLYALQIASQNIDRRSRSDEEKTVRSMAVNAEGDEFAPKVKVCEDGDCTTCTLTDKCDSYDPDDKGPLTDGEDENEIP